MADLAEEVLVLAYISNKEVDEYSIEYALTNPKQTTFLGGLFIVVSIFAIDVNEYDTVLEKIHRFHPV